jgi:hypothetical protein
MDKKPMLNQFKAPEDTDPFFFDPDEETRLTEQTHDEADHLIDLWKDSQLELNFED